MKYTKLKITLSVAMFAFAAVSNALSEQTVGAASADMKIEAHQRGTSRFSASGAFSAMLMFKVETGALRSPIQALLLSFGNGYYEGFRLNLVSDDTLGAYHPNLEIGRKAGAWGMNAPAHTVNAGEWRRLAVTWDGKTAKIYIDGGEIARQDYSGVLLAPADPRVRVGIPGEAFGLRSVPFLVERAAVVPRAMSADEVRAWAADTKPFEPDTPDFPETLSRVECGHQVSPDKLDAMKTSSFHAPLAILALDRAKVFALITEKRFDEAAKLADDVADRFPRRDREFLEKNLRRKMRNLKMSTGGMAGLVDDFRADYEKARAEGSGHLPYTALALAKALDLAGRADEAAKVRGELAKMDFSRIPHLAKELGLNAREPTAHNEKGASVSRAMPEVALYVAPHGDDAAEGTSTRPFRTLERARSKLRAMKSAGLPPGGVAVKLRGGTYKVSSTFSLSGEADSGTPDSPIVWCAAEGETPVLDGGFHLPPLKPVTDPAALERIPEAARGHVLCCDVRTAGYPHSRRPDVYGYSRGVVPVTDSFQDGMRLVPARHPNTGWLRVEDFGTPSNTWVKTTLSDFRPWTKEYDLMATGFWDCFWADHTLPVTNVDANAGMIAVDVQLSSKRALSIRRRQTFFLLNALCALDAPGEWYLDSRSGVFYVWPYGGKTSSDFVLSSFTGPFISATKLHDVRIEGLVLQNGRGTGVVMTDCREAVFAGNVVRRFGGNGVNAHRVKAMTFSDNVFTSFGHGALEVSGGDRRTLVHSGNLISNNDFSDVENRRRTYAPHLHLAGVGAEVSHNRFSMSPSSAMRLEGNDFLITSNLVEDVLLESDDQGALDIYFNASYFGNIYSYNTWRNIGRQTDKLPCGQAAIRFDGNISGQTVIGNRFVNCGTSLFGAIQSCGGRLHVIDNNLFVDCGRGMSIANYPTNFWFNVIRPTLIKPCLVDVCVTNPPYATRYPGIADILWTNQVSHLVRNITVGTTPLLVNPPDATVDFANVHFAEMPDLKSLERDAIWRAIPDESETGPRPTPLFSCAKRNAAGL